MSKRLESDDGAWQARLVRDQSLSGHLTGSAAVGVWPCNNAGRRWRALTARLPRPETSHKLHTQAGALGGRIDSFRARELEIRPDKEDVMRLKHLVVASLMAGALAVAGATTLAQPRPDECQECIDIWLFGRIRG